MDEIDEIELEKIRTRAHLYGTPHLGRGYQQSRFLNLVPRRTQLSAGKKLIKSIT